MHFARVFLIPVYKSDSQLDFASKTQGAARQKQSLNIFAVVLELMSFVLYPWFMLYFVILSSSYSILMSCIPLSHVSWVHVLEGYFNELVFFCALTNHNKRIWICLCLSYNLIMVAREWFDLLCFVFRAVAFFFTFFHKYASFLISNPIPKWCGTPKAFLSLCVFLWLC